MDMESRSIYEDLFRIQQEFKCKKENYNGFGKYSFRNAEQMLSTLKPLLNEIGCVILFREELVDCDYMKCTCTLQRKDGSSMVQTSSIAKIDTELKAMSQSQMSGCTISYLRKYTMGALFAIDDGVDADSFDNRDIGSKINACKSKKELGNLYDSLSNTEKEQYKTAFTKKKLSL